MVPTSTLVDMELVGIAEVAGMLKVSKQRADQLRAAKRGSRRP